MSAQTAMYTYALLSIVTLPTWAHTNTWANAHTLSQQKQELGDTVNEPVCYSSIYLWTRLRNSSQRCSGNTNPSPPIKAVFLIIYHSLCVSAFLLHHASLLCTVTPLCLACLFFLSLSLIPLNARQGMSCRGQALYGRHMAATVFNHLSALSISVLSINLSESTEGRLNSVLQ